MIFAMVFFVILSCSTNLRAQEEERRVNFFANIGAITDDSISFEPFYWYAGLNFDINLGRFFMISPEANLVTYKFKFDTFFLEPALMFNARFGSFFIGGGINKFFLISGDDFDSSDLGLKLNAGFKQKNLRVRVFVNMDFDNMFKDMLVGFQIGLGF
jgi:hypothetical protein